MILHDFCPDFNWLDYGILIPFPPSRPQQILGYLEKNVSGFPGSFPGPVLAPEQAFNQLGMEAVYTISADEVARVHHETYVDVLFGRQGEDALSRAFLDIYELVDEQGVPNRYDKQQAKKSFSELFEITTLRRLLGTYLAARLALQGPRSFCFYLAGGNHHARYEWGAGFCVLNDLIFAARKLQAENNLGLIWVIDVDAHKGCGSAELVKFIRTGKNPHQFEAGAEILTLSAHMAKGWPLDADTLAKAKAGYAPLIASDVEIPVEQGEESLYCAKLEAGLLELEQLSGGRRCELAIVVDGSDPYEGDALASSALLNLSLQQCVDRDMLIFDFLQARGIKSAWVLAGGYGDRAWEAPAHFLAALSRR